MSADDSGRSRPLPTVSFALSQEQMQQLHLIAERRGVSISQVAREAFETALEQWTGAAAEDPPPPVAETSQRSPATRWPRQLRRRATHHGAGQRKAARPIP
jgi:hypothetical protein